MSSYADGELRNAVDDVSQGKLGHRGGHGSVQSVDYGGRGLC